MLKGSGAPSLNVGAGEPCAGVPCKATWGIFALEAPQVMSSGVPSAGFSVSMGPLLPRLSFWQIPDLNSWILPLRLSETVWVFAHLSIFAIRLPLQLVGAMRLIVHLPPKSHSRAG